jgi:phage tail sheath protein FI
MPEYLAPGVYVEEVSFRAKSIEGVSTSTAGFVGPARYGPQSGVPELVTSFADFERIYGGLDPLSFEDAALPSTNYLAHGVRAFFENGGKRLYISRIFSTGASGSGVANAPMLTGSVAQNAVWRARFPGSGGNVELTLTLRIGQNILSGSAGTPVLRGASPFDTVWVGGVAGSPPTGTLYSLTWQNNAWQLNPATGAALPLVGNVTPGTQAVRIVTMSVQVLYPGRFRRTETYTNLTFQLDSPQSIGRRFAEVLTSRLDSLTVPVVFDPQPDNLNGPQLAEILFGTAILNALGNDLLGDADRQVTVRLNRGRDGNRPQPAAYEGDETNPAAKTGLRAFEDIPDISIVAAPGYSAGGQNGFRTQALSIMGNLISHCERMRYRIAVLDSADRQGLADVRAFRGQVDSTYAGFYYPWIRVLDPITETEMILPPSGFVSGIYARNDIDRGVHKAPANEIVRLAIGFEVLLNKAQQDVLNPEGINCMRFFEGRGFRVWGARTISSDPEWKYVNLRRYFAYLERSIDQGTQYVVFEPNSEALWGNVKSTVEAFLLNEWQSGRLMGEKPEQAYFVRCDRSTMTQNDLDNGRLICLIGVAPIRPAEFVIFRIGQMTADKKS